MLLRSVLAVLESILVRLSSRSLGRLSHAIAWLLFGALRVRRKVVDFNLETAFGPALTPAEKSRLAVASVSSFLRTLFDFVAARKAYERVKFRFVNRSLLERAMAEGRGVYVMGIHQGNWELLCVAGTREFAQVNMALKPVGGEEMAGWVRRRRESRGVHEVPRRSQRPAWRLMIDALERREIVAVVVDQRRKKGVTVPLFGKPAQTNASLFRLWRSHHAPIIPCTIRRVGDDEHEIRFWDPLEVVVNESWDEKEFLTRNSVRLNALVERMVMWCPEGYFWVHNRWKLS